MDVRPPKNPGSLNRDKPCEPDEDTQWLGLAATARKDVDGADSIRTSAGNKLRLVLIDERPLVRTALSYLLQAGTAAAKQPGAFLILPFSSVAQFLDEYQAEGDDADTVALNIGGTSLDAERTRLEIRRLRAALPSVPLVLLSDHAEASSVVQALRYGVQGYIPTTLTPAVAMHAIRLVQAGGKFVPADTLLGTVEEPEPAVSQAPARPPPLSGREYQVLELICRGRPNKIIATELGISESTVKFYVRRIMQKLGATNRTHASFLLSRSMGDGNERRANHALASPRRVEAHGVRDAERVCGGGVGEPGLDPYIQKLPDADV